MKVSLSDMLRYSRYPRLTGIVIFLNDKMNYQLREKHVRTVVTKTQDDGTTLLTLSLDMTLPLEELGYRGTLNVTYYRIKAPELFKNGFVIPGDIDIKTLNKDYIVDKFKEKLDIEITYEEFELISDSEGTRMIFSELSPFFEGKVIIRKISDPLPVSRINLNLTNPILEVNR